MKSSRLFSVFSAVLCLTVLSVGCGRKERPRQLSRSQVRFPGGNSAESVALNDQALGSVAPLLGTYSVTLTAQNRSTPATVTLGTGLFTIEGSEDEITLGTFSVSAGGAEVMNGYFGNPQQGSVNGSPAYSLATTIMPANSFASREFAVLMILAVNGGNFTPTNSRAYIMDCLGTSTCTSNQLLTTASFGNDLRKL